MPLGFIGTGTMGHPMALSLHDACTHGCSTSGAHPLPSREQTVPRRFSTRAGPAFGRPGALTVLARAADRSWHALTTSVGEPRAPTQGVAVPLNSSTGSLSHPPRPVGGRCRPCSLVDQ